MHEWQCFSHIPWECKYHVVLIPKYHRKVLYGRLRQRIGPILRELCRPVDRHSSGPRLPGRTCRIRSRWAAKRRFGTRTYLFVPYRGYQAPVSFWVKPLSLITHAGPPEDCARRGIQCTRCRVDAGSPSVPRLSVSNTRGSHCRMLRCLFDRTRDRA